MAEPSYRHYAFRGYRMDVRTRELLDAAGRPVALTSKAFDVLRQLVEHRDRVVGKDELLGAVWPGRVVEENNLNRTVSSLRHALGVAGGDHRYIVTVPGQGYRFVADVVAEPEGPTAPPAAVMAPDAGPAPPLARAARRWPVLLGVVLGFALVAVLAWSLRDPAIPTDAPGPTLAVLPFRALSAGPRDPLLGLGLADTLVARLSQARALRVLSLSSAERAIAQGGDALAAARRLGAAYVVEGSTQRRGDRVRVNARLLAAPSGAIVWAGTFDERLDRVFTLQDGVARAVTAALAMPPQAPVARHPCEGGDAEAYRAYLTGRFLSERPTPERLRNALAAYRDAIARDPGCVPAHVGVATIYRAMAITGDRAPREVMPLSRAAAERALQIDPGSAGALAARAFAQSWYDWDWAGAEASAKRAVALNPSLPEAQFAYAHLLVNAGRFEEGLAHMRQARELDPLSPLFNALEAGFLGAAGRPEEARAPLQRALELEPDFWIALLIRGGMALDRGDARAALVDLQRAAERSQGNTHALATLAMAQVAAGERPRAEAILRALERRAASRYVPATSLASVDNALGRTAAALAQLEHGLAARDVRMAFLRVDARWNPLRREPRFRALVARVGLPGVRAAAGRF